MKFGLGLLLILSTACFAQSDFPQTDLGAEGNRYVEHRFTHYKNGHLICDAPKQNVKRVLLSGFAPFFGRTDNPSSTILQNFGDFQKPDGEIDTYGITRDMTINGGDYQICFVVVPTMWDLAAAIVINEMQNFKPQFVMMSGLGAGDLAFETGNLNYATFSGGYDIDGNAVEDSIPKEHYVLPPNDPGVPHISPLTWNATASSRLVRDEVRELGFLTTTPKAGHADNDYICNNIGFVVSVAALNNRVKLAGGLIELQTSLESAPKIGFLHYPSAIETDEDSLPAWINVLKKIIRLN